MPGVRRLLHIQTNMNVGEMCYSRDIRKKVIIILIKD